MQGPSKFAQGQETFICDLISTLKFAEADIFIRYCDNENKYSPQHFSLLVELNEHMNDVVCLT
jgi:hypothetical protein